MDLDHEDPRSEWHVNGRCPSCGTRIGVRCSGEYVRCNIPGKFTTVSPLICGVCGKNADIYYDCIVCTYTGKSNPHYEARMQDLVDQGVLERVPPIEKASSEEELLDFERAISERLPS